MDQPTDAPAPSSARRQRSYSTKVDYEVVDGKVLEMASDFETKGTIITGLAAPAAQNPSSPAPSGSNSSRGSSLFKFRQMNQPVAEEEAAPVDKTAESAVAEETTTPRVPAEPAVISEENFNNDTAQQVAKESSAPETEAAASQQQAPAIATSTPSVAAVAVVAEEAPAQAEELRNEQYIKTEIEQMKAPEYSEEDFDDLPPEYQAASHPQPQPQQQTSLSSSSQHLYSSVPQRAESPYLSTPGNSKSSLNAPQHRRSATSSALSMRSTGSDAAGTSGGKLQRRNSTVSVGLKSTCLNIDTEEAEIVKGKETIKLEALGFSHNVDLYGEKNLDNFDETNASGERILLTSPRSIEACLLQGVSAHDLIIKDKSHFEAGVGQTPIADGIVEMRWSRFEKKRQDTLQKVQKARKDLISAAHYKNNSSSLSGGSRSGTRASVMDLEKERVEKIIENDKLRYQAIIRHEVAMKKKQIDAARMAEMRREQDRLEVEARHEQARRIHEAAVAKMLEFRKQTEEKIKQQRELVKQKAREVEQRDRKRQESVESTKNKASQENEIKKRNRQIKLDAAKQKNNEAMMTKFELLQRKQEHFEQHHNEWKLKIHQMREELKREAQSKEQKIMATLQVNEELERIKVQRILDKQRQQQEYEEQVRLQELANMRRKKQLEIQKQQEFEMKLEKAREAARERVDQLLAKQDRDDQKAKEMQSRKQLEYEMRAEELRLKEQDKKENVDRMKLASEYRRTLTISKLEEKQRRAKQVQKERRELLARRAAQGKLIQRTKQVLAACNPQTQEEEDAIVEAISQAITQCESPDEIDWAELERHCKCVRINSRPSSALPYETSLTMSRSSSRGSAAVRSRSVSSMNFQVHQQEILFPSYNTM